MLNLQEARCRTTEVTVTEGGSGICGMSEPQAVAGFDRAAGSFGGSLDLGLFEADTTYDEARSLSELSVPDEIAARGCHKLDIMS